jgi:competence ComEA-like helix-hairpin-helix protein
MNRPDADPQLPPAWPKLTLRRADQAVSAALIVLALVTITVWCGYQAYLGGRTIDIERAEPIAIDFKVDVNQARWPELALMPNIGEQLAKRIVADRAERGPFKALEELRRVRGIGPKTLESMRPFLQPLSPLQSTAENEPLQSGKVN